MPNNFSRRLSRDVGTSNATIGSYTVGAGVQVTVIGLTLSNKTGSQASANIRLIDNTTTSTSIVTLAPVPPGGTLVAVGGDQKLVLTAGDSVTVQSNVANSLDVVMSILEIS
jgi:hypothetical protein